MKAGEGLRVSVLRMLSAAIHNREIAKRTKLAKETKPVEPLSEEEVLEAVMAEAKKRLEAIEGFDRGGRGDMVAKEKQELSMLQEYMPVQLSREEMVKEIDSAIAAIGALGHKDMGKAMGLLSSKLKGRADMGQISRILSQKLSGQ
jgi:hypothetical protein